MGKECWIFDFENNSWSLYSTGKYTHHDYPGVVHGDKVYLAGPLKPEIFDPANNEWTNWKIPNVSHGEWSCLLSQTNDLILLGGIFTSRTLEKFDTNEQTWTTINTSAPFDIQFSGKNVKNQPA